MCIKGRKMKKALKIIIIVIAAVAVISASVALYVNSKLNKISYDTDINIENDNITEETDFADKEDKEDVAEPELNDTSIVNILLLGTDVRIKTKPDPGRADCNMILSLNKGTGEIKLISLERGIYVPVDPKITEDGRTSDLLTHIYHWGGGKLSQKTVEKQFRVPLDGYAQVNFNRFSKVVDAIGGVDIELTQAEADALNQKRYTNTKKLSREVDVGINHLSGFETLQYCRLRYTDDDWTRQQRQRNAIAACLKQIKSLNLIELNNLADEVLPLIKTNLSKEKIADLLLYSPKFLGEFKNGLQTLQVPDKNRTENRFICCDFDYESKKISNFIYGTNYELKSPYTGWTANNYKGNTIDQTGTKSDNSTAEKN